MVALGIIDSEFPNSSNQCDVYIFQLICLSASNVQIFAAENGYFPLTIRATQGRDFIPQLERAWGPLNFISYGA